MRIHFKHICFIFLASLACMYMLDAYAAKPVKVTVTEAIPNEALQGDAVPVRIKGSGFDQGSSVRFIVTDTLDDTQIEVGTVIYDSDTGDLVAHVKVKDKAKLDDYDIEVTTLSGRRGKGTTLFRVRYRTQQPDPYSIEDGSACMDSGSFFPAFAYKFTTSQTDSLFEEKWIEIFLANAAGDCRIRIFQDADIGSIDYRFFGDNETGTGTGVIAFSKQTGINSRDKPGLIYVLKFTVVGGAIDDSMPMVPRLILEQNWWPYEWGGNIGNPAISPNGEKVLVTGYTPDEIGGFYFLTEVDVNGLPPSTFEQVPIIFSFDHVPDEEPTPIHETRYGLREDVERIYFEHSYPLRMLAFIQKGPEGWSQVPTLILEHDNGNLGVDDIGLWYLDGQYREVMAHPRNWDGTWTVEVLDIEACLSTEPPGIGEDCVIVEGIEGAFGRFTTFTTGELPALMYVYDVDSPNVGFEIRECALNALLMHGDPCYRTVIEGVKDRKRTVSGVDPAD